MNYYIDILRCKQLIKEPTQIMEYTRTMIDLLISNMYNLKVEIDRDNNITDYEILKITINKKKQT